MDKKALIKLLDDSEIYPKAKAVMSQLELFFNTLKSNRITNDSIGWMVDNLKDKTEDLDTAAKAVQTKWWE